ALQGGTSQAHGLRPVGRGACKAYIPRGADRGLVVLCIIMHEKLHHVFYRALVLTSPPWLRHQKQGRYQLSEGVAFTASDLPGPSFNKVAVFGPSPPLERLLTLAAKFYAGHEGAYGIMVEADA